MISLHNKNAIIISVMSRENPMSIYMSAESEPESISLEESLQIVEEPNQEEPPLVEEPVVEEPPSVDIIVEEPVVEEPPLVEEPVAENITMVPEEEPVPKLVFIVPYRDREPHYKIFSEHMKLYLDANVHVPYKILYIHQTDNRGFNRGAMKNIGFILVKNKYPNDYKQITLIFNDIDSMPEQDTKIDYDTTPGTIKHFYGFNYTLGGIVSINAADFERLNGFPNFWAWGFEDNLLQIRAEQAGIVIDRSVFYPINDKHILRLTEPPIRTVNRSEFDRFEKRTTEGIYSIYQLQYNVNEDTGFVNVLQFNTSVNEQVSQRSEYDLRNGPAPFKTFRPSRGKPTMGMHFF